MLRDKVRAWVSRGDEIQYDLACCGAKLIAKVQAASGWSLRVLAKRTGLSPTYLSRVATGKQTISPGAYLKLCEVLE